MTLLDFIAVTVLVALLAAFLLELAYKWGVIEWVQVHGNAFFSKMFNCNFCLSWWTGVALSVLLALVLWDAHCLLIPFVSTLMTRKLL